MYLGDSCGTPRGNLSREAAFRKGQDHLRHRVRSCLVNLLVVEQFSPYARCRSPLCNRRLNSNLGKNRETNPNSGCSSFAEHRPDYLFGDLMRQALKAGNSRLTYQANYEKDLPPTLEDETDRLLVEAMRPNR